MSKDKIFNSISDILVEFPPITDKHGDNVEKLSETVCATV